MGIRQATEIDYPAYAAFQKEVYRDLLARSKATDVRMTPEFYRWKYHSPDGMARIARVTQGEETLSYSAMLPLRTALRTFFAPVPSFLLPKRQVLVLHGAGELPTSLMRETWALQTGNWDVF